MILVAHGLSGCGLYQLGQDRSLFARLLIGTPIGLSMRASGCTYSFAQVSMHCLYSNGCDCSCHSSFGSKQDRPSIGKTV